MQLFWSLFKNISLLLICSSHALGEILALIVSVCAVYIAIHSKREARIAAQMNLFYQHMARYSSIEMHDALGIIGKLFDTRKEKEGVFLEVVKRFHNKENINDLPWREGGELKKVYYLALQYNDINDARRQVSHFFTFAFDLFTDFKVLDDVYFKKICSIETFRFLYHVIEWLELALDPGYARKTFADLLEQSGRKDIEDLRKLRPPETWDEVEQMIHTSPPKQP